ncbi:TorF family putative porin, partial [Aquisalimonas sp.]
MKKTLTALATGGLLVTSGGAVANDLGAGFAWSGNLAVTSDYIFQGASETGGRPAIQGGFDLEHASGLYLGNWNSSVQFGEGDDAYIEMDVYGGFATDLTDEVGIDVGVIHYFYPAAGGAAEFTELYAGVNTGVGDLAADFYVVYEADDGDYIYYELNLAYALPRDTYVFTDVGYVDADDSDDDFAYWHIGAGVEYAGLDF